MSFKGHEGFIKHVVFYTHNSHQFLSASDDRSVRFWDSRTSNETLKLNFDHVPNGIEVTSDKQNLLVSYGKKVAFYDLNSMTKIKEINVPTEVNSASLHPDKSVFVCGGEDFVIYKYDFNTEKQLGMQPTLFNHRLLTLRLFRFFHGTFRCSALHSILTRR